MQHAAYLNESPASNAIIARRPIGEISGGRCTASDLLRWCGMANEISRATDEIGLMTRRVFTGHALVLEGGHSEALYFVGAGTFKTGQTDTEGYEQVQGFSIKGDVIGLEALHCGCSDCSAIALEDSMVAVVPIADLTRAAQSVPALARLLNRAITRELRERSATQYLMAAASAEVRVVRFLLRMADRQVQLGFSSRHVRLLMSRRDIASFLGVAHETVSRSLTALAHWDCVHVAHREIEIIDLAGMQALQRMTRGTPRMAAERQMQGGGSLAPISVVAAAKSLNGLGSRAVSVS